ncbi:metallophosphoesterase family protein [Nakamurella panacisegetis]|uniref:metallophosphoesterase family protein n=1 Tax=Nakamurella panacisegetis TaxID=1090615 RepID=UPI000B872435|nr:metallophosphoesterase [Nakamurella panacisegetis]
MRVSFVSDVHGNIEALARAAEQAEQLVVLGDLLDYVDYHDHGNGILGAIFGSDKVRQFAAMRVAGDFPALRDYNHRLWASLDDGPAVLAEVVDRRYRAVYQAVGPEALLILGNVDVQSAWEESVGHLLPNRDGQVVEVAGRRFGFVAGGSSRPGLVPRPSEQAWRPLVRPAVEFQAALASLGPVDVLCSHIPPDLVALRYDRVPGRLEMYGPSLLEAIDEHQPDFALFGHVHQPLARRQRRGRTECINVGHFQRHPVTFDIEFD